MHFTGTKSNNDHDGVLTFEIRNSDINENSELNGSFNVYDILQSIKSLKSHKSCGNDFILNECASEKILNVSCKLFNIVSPSIWTEGITCPIYKNKGDTNNPDNYRGITVLSCFCKLFTYVLIHRLNERIVKG